MPFAHECKCPPHQQQSCKQERNVNNADVKLDVPEDLIVIDRIRERVEEPEDEDGTSKEDEGSKSTTI